MENGLSNALKTLRIARCVLDHTICTIQETGVGTGLVPLRRC